MISTCTSFPRIISRAVSSRLSTHALLPNLVADSSLVFLGVGGVVDFVCAVHCAWWKGFE